MRPKYKDNPQFYVERNKQIVKDRKSMSIRGLMIKYDLSATRIHSILAKNSNKFKGTK